MTNLQGKWALVTGANRGIGYRIATFLASQGCNLILHSREITHTAELQKKVTDSGVQAFSVAAELSDLQQVKAMLDTIEQRGINVDVLFNNAGVQVAYRSDWFTTPAEDYTTSFVINTTAPMMICYRLLPGMIKRGFGRIINVTSGIQNEPQQAGYSASKAALDKVTTDLAGTVNGTDVVISLADPGWCRTDLGGSAAPNDPDSVIPGIVLGALVDDKRSGRLFHAQDFATLSVTDALQKAAKM